jgi:hypothetical protein
VSRWIAVESAPDRRIGVAVLLAHQKRDPARILASVTRQRGSVAPRIVGVLVLAVGIGLLTGPWWSSTLPASDRPLVLVLGAIFSGMGVYAAIPDRFPRARIFAFALFMGAFGLACAALAMAYARPDGTVVVAGISGFVASGPMPIWARLVAGFFALVCLSVSAIGIWGLLRGDSQREPPDPD